jgi:hypothetical protein
LCEVIAWTNSTDTVQAEGRRARDAGGLTKEEVEGMRTGRMADPAVSQVAALAAVFGVEPSYLVNHKEPPLLDAELLDGMRDETRRDITREALHLPEREREIVLGIVRQFGE